MLYKWAMPIVAGFLALMTSSYGCSPGTLATPTVVYFIAFKASLQQRVAYRQSLQKVYSNAGR